MEENLSNPDREEDIRINKNDISPNKKSTSGFKPLEQIADKDINESFDKEDSIEDEIEKTEEEIFKDFIDEINYDKNSEARKIEQINTDIRISQSEGVVSVGPDVEGENIENEVNKDIKNIDLGPLSVNIGLETMNPEKRMDNFKEIKKYNKTNKSVGKSKENLKTIPPSKKERSLRGMIRNILGMQNNEMTEKQRREVHFLELTDNETN